MPVITPEDFAAILQGMPQDMAAKAAATATAAGGAAAEAVELFTTVDESITLGYIATIRAWAARSWKARSVNIVLQVAALLGLEKALSWILSKGVSTGFALSAGLWPDITGQMAFNAYKELDSFTPIGLNLTAKIYEHIFPGSMSAADITNAYSHAPILAQEPNADEDFFGVLGTNVEFLFAYMFDEPGVAANFLSRTSSDISQKNFRRVMGANLAMQIRAQTMAVVAQMFPLGPLKHIGELHSHLVNAMGLNRLAHTMLSVLSSNLIHKGLQQDLNRRLLPRDLTEPEAFDAALMGLMSNEERDRILSNEGVRLDVRPKLERMRTSHLTETQAAAAFVQGRIDSTALQNAYNHHKLLPEVRTTFTDMAESDLPDGDVQAFYQHGRLSEDDVLAHFRLKGYRQERAELERDSIVEQRTWELLGKVTDSYGRLYRDEVVGEGEYRQFLDSQGWSANEEDLQIAYLELERRQRTFLSNADLGDAVDQGILTTGDMFEELTARGYTPEDATIVIMLQLKKHLPDCDKEKVKQDALIAFLQGIGAQGGVNPLLLKPQVLRYLQCLNAAIPLILPIAHIKATPQVTAGEALIELEWSTEFATSAKIDPQLGNVPLSGKTQIDLKVSRSYTLTATNPLGSSKAFAFIPFQGIVVPTEPGAEPPPQVTFTADRSSITAGDSVLLTWAVTGAGKVSISHGVGTVPLNGEVRVKPSQDAVYVLTAETDGAKPTSVVAFVQIAVADKPTKETVPAPLVSLAADKAVISADESVTLTWHVTGAERITIDHGVGTVGPDGSTRVTPSGDTTYALTATIKGASAQAFAFVSVNPLPTVKKVPPPPPPTISISASAILIDEGDPLNLNWTSIGADVVSIDHGVGAVPINGSIQVRPTSTTYYAATARNKGGSKNAYVLVVVTPKPPKQPDPTPPPPPVVRLTADKVSIDEGETVTLQWQTEGAATVRIAPTVGSVPLAGSFPVRPTRTTIYTLTASNSALEAGPTLSSQGFVTVTVTPKPKT